jgi:CBS domain containing-hemolysin-like protein
VVSTILGILVGVLVVFAITALTGYFVAQEFGFMAVEPVTPTGPGQCWRCGGTSGAGGYPADVVHALRRPAGITVTGLVVGYVAEPMIGEGIGELLGLTGVPTGVGITAGTIVALLFVTVVQMVFGELFPKNLAISRPESVARALA